MKRIFSILLIIATLLSSIAIPVFAEETVISDEGKLPFEDVKADYWFYDAAVFCYANNIINGMDKYTFDFSGKLTRAQFVQMLANLEGADTSVYTVNKFSDVRSNHWYYGAVAWAYEKGIVNGMSETTFAPNNELTRAQLATVMCNYMKDKYTVVISDELLGKYTDKPKESYWYYESVRYVVSAGLISGVTETTIVPTGVVTRAQAATIIKSFMEQYFYGNCEHVFEEADCASASQCIICGLKSGLPLGHRLTAYDCTTGGVCQVCNEEVGPSRYIHDFSVLMCGQSPACKGCGERKGAVTTHTTKNGLCTICQKEVFSDDKAMLFYYLKKYEGTVITTDSYTVPIELLYTNGDMAMLELKWENETYYISCLYIFADGTEIAVNFTDRNNGFWSASGNGSELIFEGWGTITPQEFNSNYYIKFSHYYGDVGFRNMFGTLTRDVLTDCLLAMDPIIRDICGKGVEIFGFTNLK